MADLTLTTFDWVPEPPRGFVRDLRVRWALEEAALPYRVVGVPFDDRGAAHLAHQPFGQVPWLTDGELSIFESGAILLHLGERDERLLPRDPPARADAQSWLFAAYNSVEPMLFELSNVEIFSAGEPWAELRKPSLIAAIEHKLDRLAAAMGDREWLAGQFSIADIAMATVLRQAEGSGLLADRPVLLSYLERAIARPAFKAALAAQLADFKPEHAPA